MALMKDGRRRSLHRARWIVVGTTMAACTVGAGLLAASASGTRTSAAANGVAEAKRLVALASRPVPWRAPGPAFDASKAKGKSIWYISIFLTADFEKNTVKGLAEVGKATGVNVHYFDGKAQAAEFTRGIQQAISQKAGVIILGAIEPKLVAPALADAKKAGIPVIVTHTQNPGKLLPGTPPGVVASATHSYTYPGKVEADFIVADSGGKANVVFVSSSDVGTIAGLLQGAFTAELKHLCKACKVKSVDVPVAQWSTLTQKTPNIIRSNQDANYLVPVFDGMAVFMVPGVHAANAQDKVKIVSFNATPAVMDSLGKGDVVAANVGSAQLWEGWAIGDQALRVLSGVRPLLDVKDPERLFTQANVKSINLKAQESTWYSPSDFKKSYMKLWRQGK